ncbi:antibiotic biosynthesis monooxygenase family protein [Corynebacterium cystitidis]|uniref:antibiotic biosynthesis monooxygenase family protein n=1 Tax=Corynebacterium cystitidis TaxID=35757 RepID=UPI00211DEBE3|nr:antibiotic biosynthesis monooxygenase [Corynebacterium cystitidis]
MTFINITALSAPAGMEKEIEQRFAARQRSVDQSPGFQEFELLRPVFGEERYFVVTKWDSQQDYEAWVSKRDKRAHDGDDERGMSVELFGFEVVQHEEK